LDEGFALRGREEEGFCIGAKNDEPREAGLGEVGEVFGLGIVVDFIVLGVEEGYCWRPGRELEIRL